MTSSKKTRFDGVVVFPREQHLAPGDPLDTAKTDILWNNIHALAACNTSIRYNLQTSETVPTAGSATGTRSGRLTLYPTTGFSGFPSADTLLQDVPYLLYKSIIKVNLNNDNGLPFALDVKVKLASYTASGTGDLKVYFHFGGENILYIREAGDWVPTTTSPPTELNTLYCNIASTAATTTDMTLYRYGTTRQSNVVLPEVMSIPAVLDRTSHVPGGLGETIGYAVTYLSIWVISNKDMGSTTSIYLDGLTIREIPYDDTGNY